MWGWGRRAESPCPAEFLAAVAGTEVWSVGCACTPWRRAWPRHVSNKRWRTRHTDASSGRRWIYTTALHHSTRRVSAARRLPLQAVFLLCSRVPPRSISDFFRRKRPRPCAGRLSATGAKRPHFPGYDGVGDQVGLSLLEVALCPLLHCSPPLFAARGNFEHIEGGSLRKSQQALGRSREEGKHVSTGPAQSDSARVFERAHPRWYDSQSLRALAAHFPSLYPPLIVSAASRASLQLSVFCLQR